MANNSEISSKETVYTIEADENGKISAADKKLLRQSYDTVYLKAFNIPEEQLSFRQLCADVKDGATVTLVSTTDKKPVIKALAIGYHYEGDTAHPDVGLLGYLATDPQFQGQGLGKRMDAMFRQTALRRAEERGQPLGGVFLECNIPTKDWDKKDPKTGEQKDVMDPAKRIEMYKHWGAVELPMFYAQPALELGGGSIPLRLLVEPNPKTGKYPTMDDIKTYLTGIYTESRDTIEGQLLEGAEKSEAKIVKLREEAKKASPAEAAKFNKRAAAMEKRAAKMKAQADALPSVEQNPDYRRSMADLAKIPNLDTFYKSELSRQHKPSEASPDKKASARQKGSNL